MKENIKKRELIELIDSVMVNSITSPMKFKIETKFIGNSLLTDIRLLITTLKIKLYLFRGYNVLITGRERTGKSRLLEKLLPQKRIISELPLNHYFEVLVDRRPIGIDEVNSFRHPKKLNSLYELIKPEKRLIIASQRIDFPLPKGKYINLILK